MILWGACDLFCFHNLSKKKLQAKKVAMPYSFLQYPRKQLKFLVFIEFEKKNRLAKAAQATCVYVDITSKSWCNQWHFPVQFKDIVTASINHDAY
jgi:hypothetical protein